jgi:RHH-type proline utilization regulon transcriptional repressor/proline dehydrogenase/delta 1-pyrroline-5-carboxylate dehydrogenase
VVGVQPFGGEGLSGTGPKAGGALMMTRLSQKLGIDWLERMGLSEELITQTRKQAIRGLSYLSTIHQERARLKSLFEEYATFLQKKEGWLPNSVERFLDLIYAPILLDGITGEHNAWWLIPRGRVGIVVNPSDNKGVDWTVSLLKATALALATGNRILWVSCNLSSSELKELQKTLPSRLAELITCCCFADFKEVAGQALPEAFLYLQDRNAIDFNLPDDGEIRPHLWVNYSDFEQRSEFLMMRLVHERAISINTAAAGGNTSLMTMS